MGAIKIQQVMPEEENLRRFYTAENPAITGILPEGYMRGKEFWGLVRENVTKLYKESGLL